MTSSVQNQNNVNLNFFEEQPPFQINKSSMVNSKTKVLDATTIQAGKWRSAAKIAALGFVAIAVGMSAYYFTGSLSNSLIVQQIKLEVPQINYLPSLKIPKSIESETISMLENSQPPVNSESTFNEPKVSPPKVIERFLHEIPEPPLPVNVHVFEINSFESQYKESTTNTKSPPASEEVNADYANTGKWTYISLSLTALVALAYVIGIKRFFNKSDQNLVALTDSNTTKKSLFVKDANLSEKQIHLDGIQQELPQTFPKDKAADQSPNIKTQEGSTGEGNDSSEANVLVTETDGAIKHPTLNPGEFCTTSNIEDENNEKEIKKTDQSNSEESTSRKMGVRINTRETLLHPQPPELNNISIPPHQDKPNSDLPPTDLPPEFIENPVNADNNFPPMDLPPELIYHKAFTLGNICQEFFQGEVSFSEQLEVMAKLKSFLNSERLQELSENISPELKGPLQKAFKELLETNNIEILLDFSKSLIVSLQNPQETLTIQSITDEEKDRASIDFATIITYSDFLFSNKVINAAFRHNQACVNISSILNKISVQSNEMEKTPTKNNTGMINNIPAKTPWIKSMKAFVKEYPSLKNADVGSFESAFIAVAQHFPRMALFSKNILKNATLLKDYELIKSASDFNLFMETQTQKLNDKMKERELLEEGMNIVNAVEKSKKTAHELVLDQNSKIICRITSLKHIVFASGIPNEIYDIAASCLNQCIAILNRRQEIEELAKYTSETILEFDARKKQIYENDRSSLDIFEECLKYLSKNLNMPSNKEDQILNTNLEIASINDLENGSLSVRDTFKESIKERKEVIKEGIKNIIPKNIFTPRK